MDRDRANRMCCAVCGIETKRHNGWFLVMDNHWLDRVKILSWHPVLASTGKMRSVCGKLHLKILLTHWLNCSNLQLVSSGCASTPTVLDGSRGGMGYSKLALGQVLGELQVQELQQKVKALEAKQGTPPPTPAVEPAQATSAADAAYVARMREDDLHGFRGIQWRGFGEVNYKVLDQRTPELGTFGFVPGSAGGFYTGDFDLFLTSRVTDKASVLAEIVIGEGDAQSFDVDLERVLLKYDYNDHLKMSFGRYHTGIGYYNTAFHSGKWMQTTADRPLIMEFAADGGLLPTQAIGVSVTGSIPSGHLGLNYTAEYGSSDTIRPEVDIHDGEVDENNGNHFNVGLFGRPDGFPGLQIGGSIYHDKISDFIRGPSVRLGQTIANAHVVYTGHGMEFVSEGFLIHHVYENNGPTYNTSAFYAQFSKKFGHIRPFVRYQYINANPNGIFEDVGLRHGPSFGARYDINDYIAFKAQFDHTVRGVEPELNGLQLQLAFTF